MCFGGGRTRAIPCGLCRSGRYGGTAAQRHADSGGIHSLPNSDTSAHANAYPNSDTDSHTHTNTDTNSHPNAHADP